MLTTSTADQLLDERLRSHLAACNECRDASQLVVAAEQALASGLEAEASRHRIEPVLAVLRYATRVRTPDARRARWASRACMAGIALLWLIAGAVVLTSIVLSMLRRFSH